MYGGAEHQEPEEVRAKEIAGAETILQFVSIGAFLYFSSHAINFVSGMISKN